jgi:predicted DNA-binding transcriptional regulator AlpA
VNTDTYLELEHSLPPILARTEIPKLTGGLISVGHLANLDSLGRGPRKITLGRKVGYLRSDFIEWLRSRNSDGGRHE